MARSARQLNEFQFHHLLNRSVDRKQIFHDAHDFEYFLLLMEQAQQRHAIPLFSFTLMPNHFHLLAWVESKEQLSRWMQHVQGLYARYHHKRWGTSGHLWQGRFRAFEVRGEKHLATVARYIEANALRARLVERAEHWPFCSLAQPDHPVLRLPAPGPAVHDEQWCDFVNQHIPTDDIRMMHDHTRNGRSLTEQSDEQSLGTAPEAPQYNHLSPTTLNRSPCIVGPHPHEGSWFEGRVSEGTAVPCLVDRRPHTRPAEDEGTGYREGGRAHDPRGTDAGGHVSIDLVGFHSG